MSSFVLKIIAIISMLSDHAGYIITGKISFFNCIGRLAFPIFAFQISEGYTHTKNLKKYFIRLLVFAVISQIPFMLFLSILTDKFLLNIFFTLALGLLAILVFDKCKYKIIGIFAVGLIAYIANIIKVDYGAFGVLIIACFYIFKDSKVLMTLSYLILVFYEYYDYFFDGFRFHIKDYRYLVLTFSTMIAIIPILLYNKKQGKKVKYFIYAFYPVHLILIYLINTFLL